MSGWGAALFAPGSYSPAAAVWRRASLTLAVALGLACGGCSLSYQFDSMFEKGSDDTTGSIAKAAAQAADGKTETKMPPDGDLAFTKAAAKEVLARGGKDTSLPWENPKTGARGTVTPIAAAYTQNGETCRDFLASYVNGPTESWLQGEACKERGAWAVRDLKPWKRS